MMFKAYILLGLLFAVFLITSNVVAETTNDEKSDEQTREKAQVAGGGFSGPGGGYGGGKDGSGGGYGGGKGGGGGGYGGGWGGGDKGGCRFGCCGWNKWGGCRCCYNAKEATAYMENEATP